MAMLRPEWANIKMSLGMVADGGDLLGLELVPLRQVEGDRALVGLGMGDVEVVGLGGRRRHVVAELLARRPAALSTASWSSLTPTILATPSVSPSRLSSPWDRT
jgi:hypothetical protein